MAKTNDYKIFSFPYLCEDTEHYKKTEFKLEVTPRTNNNKSLFIAEYTLNNPEILELLAKGKLKATLKLKCGHMGLVKYYDYKQGASTIKIELLNNQIDNNIDFIVYLVALENIEYTNKDLSSDWSGFTTTIIKGNIIGESQCRTVYVSHNKLSDKKSIFRFTRKEYMNEDDPFMVDISDDNIHFELSNKMFKNYKIIEAKNPQAIVDIFILPVVVDILRRMQEDDSEDANEFNSLYRNYNWYKVITLKYEKLFDCEPTSVDVPPLVAAQKLFKNSINICLTKIKEGTK